MRNDPPLEVRVVGVALVEVPAVEEDGVGLGLAEAGHGRDEAGDAAEAVVGG